MNNGIYGLFSDMKTFLSNGVNGLSVLVIIAIIMNIAFFLVLRNDVRTINYQLEKTKDAVHFRYFNLTRSLEDFWGVKIDTHTGYVQKF